jgi:hypothetical protein
MPYEPGMQIVFDLISQMAVVSFRGRVDTIGPFATQRLAREAGERYCRERGWIDNPPAGHKIHNPD